MPDVPLRREPPRFRPVEVVRVEPRNARLVRVTLAGPALEGFVVEEPAASVRLLLPTPGTGHLVLPAWNGNEFLLADGTRPVIRTFTPERADPAAGELDLTIVLHGPGVASEWAANARPGRPAAVSGPGRGYTIASDARAFVLAGDEGALPAMAQLLERLPAGCPVAVHAETDGADACLDFETSAAATVEWHPLPAGEPPGATLVAALQAAPLPAGAYVWAAGEAAAMQRIRKLLLDERAFPRARATIRGYWKYGRGGDDA